MSLIIDIDDIPEDRPLELDLTESVDQFAVDPEAGSLKGAVRVQGSLIRSNRDVYLAGEVETVMAMTCSRCLEAFEMDVETPITATFIPAPDPDSLEAEQELVDSDIEIEYYKDQKIDLTQPVYDQIMLSLPMVQLCRDDCKGICPKCGASLNREVCRCDGDEDVDPRLAVLKQLKDKLK
ncbi:YceD family protein [Nitrospina gracilis]|uniref:YceD family protein n=1 Tax=Nitrospina gracilis TaxID=35801 RepID=UPI001F298936|nr:YceD family protein [Nitrospina gracilis]MCF8720560.1 uncharacterized protein [Nitrospina gracilis Nb-211]